MCLKILCPLEISENWPWHPPPQEDGWGNNVFALGGFTVENLGGGGGYMGENVVF